MLGANYKYRFVGETLMTILTSKKIIEKNFELIKKVSTEENDPFEKPLHKIFESELCVAPIYSLSYHMSRHFPSVENDWLKVWEENYEEINGGP